MSSRTAARARAAGTVRKGSLLRLRLLRFRLLRGAAHHPRRWGYTGTVTSTLRASYASTSAAGFSPLNMTTSAYAV